jgi:hypothetical protein
LLGLQDGQQLLVLIWVEPLKHRSQAVEELKKRGYAKRDGINQWILIGRHGASLDDPGILPQVMIPRFLVGRLSLWK